MRTKSLNLFVV